MRTSILRRIFGEGAFSQAFVPVFSEHKRFVGAIGQENAHQLHHLVPARYRLRPSEFEAWQVEWR